MIDKRCPYCASKETRMVTLKETEEPGLMQEIPYTHIDENGKWCRFTKMFLCDYHIEKFKEDIIE